MKPIFLAVLLALAVLPAVAEDGPGAIAREAAVLLDEAAGQLARAESARDRVKALTATVRAYERGLAAMREGLRQTAVEERALRAELSDRDVELTRLLAVLLGIERDATGARMLHPEGPLPSIRAGLLASAVVPAVNDRARALAAELAELHAVVAIREAGQKQLEDGLAGIRDARLALTQAMSNRTPLPGPAATDDAAMEALINSAETLTAFADNFTTTSPWTNMLEESWPMPVEGELLRRFDEADAAGVARPGWIVATEPAALISAPSDGTVRFAGDMPDFGGVLILEPRPGEMLILAGAGQIYVRRGQIVGRGDPLGSMPGAVMPAQDNLIETVEDGGQRARETLYIEFRHGTEAIDPAARFDGEAE